MPNHVHLLLRQLKDSGIFKFMKKFGSGYGRYFNKKYNRKGYVFQNRFLAVPIKTDKQLKVVFAYIHANPVSLIEPKWKERGIKNFNKVIKFIENVNVQEVKLDESDWFFSLRFQKLQFFQR